MIQKAIYTELKKNLILSIVNDAINLEIKNFFHSNYSQLFYTKYYGGSGLAELHKTSEMGSEPNTKKIWNYNYLFSINIQPFSSLSAENIDVIL